MSEKIRIHVLHCGMVHTSPYLPYDTDGAGMLKVAGIGVPKDKWVWMLVSAYYIEHPKGKILVDTGRTLCRKSNGQGWKICTHRF